MTSSENLTQIMLVPFYSLSVNNVYTPIPMRQIISGIPDRLTKDINVKLNKIFLLSEDCPICLDFWCNVETKCSHSFCESCIREWKKNNDRCPICRSSIF